MSPIRAFENRTLAHGLAPGDRARFRRLLSFLTSVTSAMNATAFLYGGTLLGCLRSGDVLPWDDDVDVAMDRADVGRVNATIAAMVRGPNGTALSFMRSGELLMS